MDGRLDLEDDQLPNKLGFFNCAFPDGISLNRAKAGVLDFSGSWIRTIDADRLESTGGLFLRHVGCLGGISLIGAQINDSLAFDDAYLAGSNLASELVHHGLSGETNYGPSLTADRLRIEESVSLERTVCRGEVRLPGSRIGDQLICKGVKFNNPVGNSFLGDGMIVDGVFSFSNAICNGETRFLGSRLGSDIVCTASTFENYGGYALNAANLNLAGTFHLQKVICKGEVCLDGARINKQLSCDGSIFYNGSRSAISLQDSKIDGALFIRGKFEIDGGLDLTGAYIKRVSDDQINWVGRGYLGLNSFVYESFEGVSPIADAKSRIKWLELQPPKPFRPQPYTQLAKVFRNMGKDADARKVLLARERRRREFGEMPLHSKIWSWILDGIAGFGYQWWKPVAWTIAFIFLGLGLFCASDQAGLVKLVGETESLRTFNSNAIYPEFNPFLYSLDSFVPFLDLKQERLYFINTFSPVFPVNWYTSFHVLLRIYHTVHAIFGWFLMTIVIAALTGIMQKEK